METLIPFVSGTENYALPDSRTITTLISPSVNKHLAKNQNLFRIDTQRFQPLSIKSYVNVNAITDNPSDDNELIPTPPLSESPTSAKRLVTFQLDDETDDETTEQAVETPTIEKAYFTDAFEESPLHLHCLQISHDILVSMLEREVEIRDLVKANKEFFDVVKATVHSNTKWQKFEEVLYMEREALSDKEWMLQLSEFLAPALWMKFKDIVGYWPSDDTQGTVSHDDTYYVNPLWIRDYPEKLASFEKLYPEFFVTAFKEFDQNRELYEEFKRILFATRHEMSDEEWENKLNEILNRFPSLLGQFEDILEFELELQETDEM